MKKLALLIAAAGLLVSGTAFASDIAAPAVEGYNGIFPTTCNSQASALFKKVFHKYAEYSTRTYNGYVGIDKTPNLSAEPGHEISCYVVGHRHIADTSYSYTTVMLMTVENKGHGRILFWRHVQQPVYLPGMGYVQ